MKDGEAEKRTEAEADKVLVIVDMQNDFVTGALGTGEAVSAAENTVKKALEFCGQIVFTMDTHAQDYADTQEGRLLPIAHCIKGTDGRRLVPELEELCARRGLVVFEKNTFGSVELAQFLLKKYEAKRLKSVELVGLCTDICVISNALMIKAFMPELIVSADISCCAGSSPDKHEAALKTMQSCQIILKRGEENVTV